MESCIMSEPMYQYAVYKHPKDYPDKFVLRLWIITPGNAQAGPLVCVGNSLEEVRQSLPDGLVKLPRFENDDPVLEEVWI